uniref:hypothetical protein n=1 Tax=uncultured Erythrobacter sp. TaxID=263913 RepID=UPI002633B2B2|nr:hypothetical protein [uncultured Erythrobacter sp.]
MILRRITQHVREQNWTAIGIDFVIVVAGVFLGIQLGNWNEARAVRAETNRTLELLIPANQVLEANAADFQTYYATTKAYGETALRAWEDQDAVSDSDFLVAAYQASQIMAGTSELEVFAELIGADYVRNIDDDDLQRRVQNFIINPSNLSRMDDIDTPYRQNVRRVIPFAIQEEIRTECGDQRDDILKAVRLPAECSIDLPAERARIAAETLRARTDLRDDLQWHMASIQSVLADLDNELDRNQALMSAVERYLK